MNTCIYTSLVSVFSYFGIDLELKRSNASLINYSRSLFFMKACFAMKRCLCTSIFGTYIQYDSPLTTDIFGPSVIIHSKHLQGAKHAAKGLVCNVSLLSLLSRRHQHVHTWPSSHPLPHKKCWGKALRKYILSKKT